MVDHGLKERARQARQAQAEMHAAFSQVVNRHDSADPRTRRWFEALKRLREALSSVLPAPFHDVFEGDGKTADLHTDHILDFLETDPIFHRSGYIRERLLREVKRRPLTDVQARQLQDIVLHIVQNRDCRELRYYCTAAAACDDDRLRGLLMELERSGDKATKRRACWMLRALEHTERSKVGALNAAQRHVR